MSTLKDDKSVSTLSSHDCSHDGAPSAAFNDGWTTFEEWNYNKRPSYQISDDLFNKMTCNIFIEEVFIRFISKGELSGCKHDFCYRFIWKWENTTIIEGNCFQRSVFRMVCTPIDQIMYKILSEDASKFMTVLNAYLLDEVQEKTCLQKARNEFFMLFYWMTEHQQICRTCNAVSTNMEGGYSFLL